MPNSEALLSAQGVAKLYGRKLVFKKVGFSILPGQVWLLVGPNGAGKSTLVNIAAGLLGPDAGKIDVTPPPNERSYLGHKTFIYPRLSALENLRFWADMYGLGRDRAALMAALERVELGYVAEEEAGRFSRGMSQRLSLARVFLNNPRLIFLDEPGTGLDVASAGLLHREITQAGERGAGILWVSHQLREGLEVASHVLHLEKGRVRYAGEASGYTAEECAC
ncbi:MAG: ABC transporter ATP-binding protein [Desulfovibrio sp.]|uniref:ABC transporter ATP-binding protein n=1 Tax=Desulfovibrio sp. 7SRBS1 TaxID=3378064 RepID=UPI003B406706